jgi:hypothetical protein
MRLLAGRLSPHFGISDGDAFGFDGEWYVDETFFTPAQEKLRRAA